MTMPITEVAAGPGALACSPTRSAYIDAENRLEVATAFAPLAAVLAVFGFGQGDPMGIAVSSTSPVAAQ